MTPETWKKIKDIVADGAVLDTVERTAFLDERCPPEFRADVERLLNSDNIDARILDSDAVTSFFDATGDRVGAYEIVSELGSGGMGAVYLARRADGAFDQQVALKLIKCGMDSDAVLERFVNERQILATLEHPNIAHIIDGGTSADGLPYFVMEYVEGKSILDYSNNHSLGLDERLELFREVCSAVAYAHQNLVIHRDLKPSNILVTGARSVKLLDFGIAKLLKGSDEDRTTTKNFVFTPEYASPEQVRGETLTTATDVYSLGVILYELLSGRRPYSTSGKSIGEIIQAVCETEPEPPSSVVRRPSVSGSEIDGGHAAEADGDRMAVRFPQLRGDLDNIILKALRKEPERRYSSVEQFADDIRRHQVGLPVMAVRDTWAYRASKFVGRNRVGVGAAALILVTLFSGLFATLYQRNRAQRRFNDVRQIANSFLFEFHDAIKDLPGATPARELLVKRAVEYLDQLAQESQGDVALSRELAAAYAAIGQIQGNSYHSNLGDSDGAMRSYRHSLEIRRSLAASDPNNRELQHELAESLEGVGDMHYTLNELNEGLDHYEAALEIREKLTAAEPADPEYRLALAGVLSRRGDISGMEGFPNLGDVPRALESYQRALPIYEELVKTAPDNEKYLAGYAAALHFYGMMQNAVGDPRGAIENGRKSVDIFNTLIAASPNSAKYEVNLMAALVFLRYPLVDEQLFDEATTNARRVIATMEKQVAADPKNAFNRRSLGVAYNALGRIQTEMKDGAAALENHAKALKIANELSEADPENVEGRRDLAMTREFIADAMAAKGDHSLAIENYRAAIDLYGPGSGEDLAASYLGLGRSMAGSGRLQEAADSFRQAVPSAEKAALKSPENVKRQTRLAIYYFEGGRVLARLAAAKGAGEQEAREWLEKSSRIFNDLAAAGKLAKLHSRYPSDADAELKRIS